MTYQNFQDENFQAGEEPALSASHISTDLPPEQETSTGGWLSGSKGLLIGLGLGLGLALVGTRLAQRQPEPTAVTAEAEQVSSGSVTTVLAESAPIRETITASGTVEAFDLLSVASRANGLQIQSVAVREGDRVFAGQVLAVLDDSVLRAQIQQAEAQVTSAQAQVVQAEAQVAEDRAQAAEAKEKYDRFASLFSQGAISEEALVERRTQLVTQQQAVGSSIAAIDSAEATVRSRQAEVTQLNTQLDQTQVIAPDSGVIAEKSATVGDIASAGTPLFKIISGDQLELALTVPQTQLPQVNVGSSVQITSGSDPNLQLQGTVRSIDPTVDAQSRKATVKVGLPGSDRLRPGMFLQAAIVTGSRQGVVVPAEAVLPQTNGGFIVYVLNPDNTVKAKAVEVGVRVRADSSGRTPAAGDTPARIEITSGLRPDTPVVVEGASYLQDGDLVDVASQSSTTPATASSDDAL